MAEIGTATLLERKIAAARPRGDPLTMTAERALALALARVAEKTMRLPIDPVRMTLATLNGGEIVDTLPDAALLAMIEGPKEALGLAVLDSGTLAALIEMMTLGRLAAADPVARRPTRTDAAMVAGFLDGVLGQLDILLAAEPDVIWAGGFRYASHLADPRPLGLMLDEPDYRVFRMTLRFGEATGPDRTPRQGEVMLALPSKGRGAQPLAAESADATAAPGNAQDQGWEAALQDAVMGTQTDIRAILGRVILPLADVLQLEAGVSLPLPMAALQMVQIEAEGAAEVVLCLGQLGQGNGRRALRLFLPEAGAPEVYGLPPMATEVVPASAQPITRSAPRKAMAALSDPTGPVGAATAVLDDAVVLGQAKASQARNAS